MDINTKSIYISN